MVNPLTAGSNTKIDVIIYTDGGCEPNPGPGGWGAMIFQNMPGKSQKIEIGGYAKTTTNNRMELQAVINALETVSKPSKIVVFSDSQYVVNGIGSWSDNKPIGRPGWMVGWERYGWTRKEKELLNKDLWKKLRLCITRHKSVKLKWVKGHAGNEFNERCDQIAYEHRLKGQYGNIPLDGLRQNRSISSRATHRKDVRKLADTRRPRQSNRGR